MAAAKSPHGHDPPWTPWAGPASSGLGAERPWQARMRLQTFRFLLALGTAALVFLAMRTLVLKDKASLPDIANALFFAMLLVMTFVRPNWLAALTWLGLVSLFVNAVDGLDLYSEDAVGAVHLLLPLFILYAALLGDLYMSAVAMAGVLGIYAATWLLHEDPGPRDTVMLTNLIVFTLLSGTAALGVWLRHSRLEKMLDMQAKALRTELETRLRVQAMVTHDIRTPLTALINASELEDPEIVQEMAGRISRIVDSAQALTRGAGITPSAVAIEDIWKYTSETFAAKLADKGQTLAVAGDTRLVVEADLPILCNSVIGNFLSNAIKFSPRGATIRMVAQPVGESVRIAVLDEGPGLPAEMVQTGPDTLRRHSSMGTEGEPGTGYGMQIAALCAARMNGQVEIGGRPAGGGLTGGAVSVLLPRYRPADKTAVDSQTTSTS